VTSLYVDESKNRAYLLVAAVVRDAEAAVTRRMMRGFVLPGQRRLHFTKESDSRRRAVLSELVAAGVRAKVFESAARSALTAREACLIDLVSFAGQGGHRRLMLERDESLEVRDRRVLFRELDAAGLRDSVEYVFQAPRLEPLLWIPDAIAWSVARGGEWRRRVAPLLTDER